MQCGFGTGKNELLGVHINFEMLSCSKLCHLVVKSIGVSEINIEICNNYGLLSHINFHAIHINQWYQASILTFYIFILCFVVEIYSDQCVEIFSF